MVRHANPSSGKREGEGPGNVRIRGRHGESCRMIFRSLLVLAMLPVTAGAAAPLPLAPHQAVYELALAPGSADFVDAEGRIALKLQSETCGTYALDYRFVAKFQQEEEVTVTDQQTISTENVAGTEFSFTTKTFVDGSPEKEIRGAARREGNSTKVSMQSPQKQEVTLPLSYFPLQHTAALIEHARAGERIVEAKLFDGDDDAGKLLTSTAIIGPSDLSAAGPAPVQPNAAAVAVEGAAKTEDATPAPGRAAAIDKELAGLQSWKISESYYNSDSDPDGMPIFETTYVLYENGVSDQLTLNFGEYTFKGALSQLELLQPGSCK